MSLGDDCKRLDLSKHWLKKCFKTYKPKTISWTNIYLSIRNYILSTFKVQHQRFFFHSASCDLNNRQFIVGFFLGHNELSQDFAYSVYHRYIAFLKTYKHKSILCHCTSRALSELVYILRWTTHISIRAKRNFIF